MRKSTILLASLLLGLGSCSSDRNSYLADVNVKNDGSPFFAVHRLPDGVVKIDTLSPNGDFFRIKGSSDSLAVVDVLNLKRQRLFSLYLHNGIHLNAKGDISKPGEIRITGDPLNEAVNGFERDRSALLDRLRALQAERRDVPTRETNRLDRIDAESDSLKQVLKEAVLRQVERNPDSRASALLVSRFLPGYFPAAECDSAIRMLEPEALAGTGIVREQLARLLKAGEEGAVGAKAPAYRLQNPNDSTVYSSSFGKKIQVIHFWDTHNYDLRETERINGLYDHFGDTLLQVTAISLDADSGRWKSEQRVLFPRIVNLWDPLGFNAPTSQGFGIRELPYTVVTDRNQEIRFRGVPADRLLRAVGEALTYRTDTTVATNRQQPVSERRIAERIGAAFLPEGFEHDAEGQIQHAPAGDRKSDETAGLRYIFRPDSLRKLPFFLKYPYRSAEKQPAQPE